MKSRHGFIQLRIPWLKTTAGLQNKSFTPFGWLNTVPNFETHPVLGWGSFGFHLGFLWSSLSWAMRSLFAAGQSELRPLGLPFVFFSGVYHK